MRACQAALQLCDPDIAPVHRILSKWLDHTRDFAHATACNGAAHSILFAQISRSDAVTLVCSLATLRRREISPALDARAKGASHVIAHRTHRACVRHRGFSRRRIERAEARLA